MATSPQGTGKEHQGDPTLKLCNELLSQMKGMSSQMDRYEKRIDELAAKIIVKSPPAKASAKNVDNMEPVFASPTNAQAQRPEHCALEKTPSVHHSPQKHRNFHIIARNKGLVVPELAATAQL